MLIGLAVLLFAGAASAQVAEICREHGLNPAMDDPGTRVLYVYGRITLRGYDPTTKFPKVTANFLDAQLSSRRLLIQKSGGYCFRRSANGGVLIIEVDGVETTRKQVSSVGEVLLREDFEVTVKNAQALGPPGVISAKFLRPKNEKTIELYQKAAEAESENDTGAALKFVKQIVVIDPEDFIAWAKLGSLHVGRNSLADAEAAFKKSLELRPEYTPALTNLGMLYAGQNQFDAAAEVFKRVIALEPESPRGYRLLGEAYLQIRKGSLALESLNRALELDPVGMAECHLLIARLYDLAGAKDLASAQYKAFLAKVPNHPDKKKFEKYIKDNPPN